MRFREPNVDTSSEGVQKVTIHNVHILDASTSMHGSKYNTALSSLNEELQKLKADTEAYYTQTMVEFASKFTKGADITRHYFIGIGANGNTPLYETVGVIIEEILAKKHKDDRVLLTVFTDRTSNAVPVLPRKAA